MSYARILVFSILFLVAGLAFVGISFYVKNSGKEDKSPSSKIAGSIFNLTGCITFVSGLLGLIFGKDLTKAAVQIYALFYLLYITIVFIVFSILIKDKNSK